MSAIVAEREVHCASPRQALWTAMTDTNRLNRALGHWPLEVSQAESGAARHVIRTKLGGFWVSYDERPYEWKEPEFFSILRVMHGGPARSLQVDYSLAPEGTGTRVGLKITVDPRWSVLRPIIALNTRRGLSNLVRTVEGIDRNLRSGKEAYDGVGKIRVHAEAFHRAAEKLRQRIDEEWQKTPTSRLLIPTVPAGAAGRRELGERLIQLLRTAGDIDVARIRPYELADQWRADRREVLRLCLDAVMAGLLDLSWDILCPSCRTAADRLSTLSELEPKAHCHMCDLSIELDLDRSVEATFRASAAVRSLQDGPYCIGGPAWTPHVMSQVVIPAGGGVEMTAPRSEGRFRLFVRGGATASLEVSPGGVTDAEITVGETVDPPRLDAAPEARLRLRDIAGEERHAKIEHLEYASRAATAHTLSTLPAFRRLFSGEVLKPGLMLKVARVALLFTDLTDSTRLYTQSGDAHAFRLVQDHFDLLEHLIGDNRGAIVKTIGDAVMAAFADEGDAVRAAVAMQVVFPDFAEEKGHPNVQLKLGVYSGPCYSVTANGMLDYFGQTVNVAARLQSVARAREIVVTEELFQRARDAGVLERARDVEHFSATLKGLAEPIPSVRLVVE